MKSCRILETLLLVIIAFAVFAPTQLFAGNIFIVAGGTGNKSGADWNNALPDIPVAPSCGNSYFVAGGTYTRTTSNRWTADCTATTPIYVYKAVDCSITAAPYCGSINPAKVAGWQLAYGSHSALFVQAKLSDLETIASRFIQICGSYYTIDGVTPVSGTPTTSGFGFIWRNPNPTGGMILASSNSCPTAAAQQTHITIKHSEFDGVNPQYGINIQSCNRKANVVTLTMAISPNGWITGNNIDVQGTTPADFNTGLSGRGVVITSISGTTIKFNQTGPDEVCVAPGYSTLNFTLGRSIQFNNSGETFNTITVADNYIHDVTDGLYVLNTTNFDFERNWIARNRSTPPWHANGLILQDAGGFSSGGGVIGNPAIVANNIWENISGTQLAGALSGTTVMNDFRFYNNVAFCTDDAGGAGGAGNPQCGVSRATGDNWTSATNPCVTNAKIIGNTFYGGAQGNSDFRLLFQNNACSTVTVQNNLWYSPTGKFTTVLGKSHVEDHNTLLGYIYVAPGTLVAPSDYVQLGAVSNPFVSVNDPIDLRLINDTIAPHLNDGLPLAAPFNLDASSQLRGGTSPWDRGAYQFNATTTPPSAPKITQVLVQ